MFLTVGLGGMESSHRSLWADLAGAVVRVVSLQWPSDLAPFFAGSQPKRGATSDGHCRLTTLASCKLHVFSCEVPRLIPHLSSCSKAEWG